MPDPAKEQEHREEADRLAKLPRADQREIVALHRSVADNPKVPKRDREVISECVRRTPCPMARKAKVAAAAARGGLAAVAF
jgi:hypothetical protein